MDDFGLTSLFVSVILLTMLAVVSMGGLWKLIEVLLSRSVKE